MRKVLNLLMLFISANLTAQSSNPIDLDIRNIQNNTQPGFQKLYDRAKKARVMFSGENHGIVEFNSRMEYTMMRSLYEHCGYRNFIIEMSPSRAYFMEQYVCHSDTQARKYLKSVSSVKFLTLFDHLHQWMQTLPEKDRIKIHGIDVERFSDMSYYLVNEALQNQKTVPPREIYSLSKVLIPSIVKTVYSNGISEYQYSGSSDYSGMKNAHSAIQKKHGEFEYYDNSWEISEVVDSLTKYLMSFEKWLSPANFERFMKGYKGLLEYNKWQYFEGGAQQYLWREESMFRNFVEILSRDSSQKFFGQFGRCHSSLVKQAGDCGWYNYKSVCSKVRSRYFGGDSTKIMSMAILYRDNSEHLYSPDMKNNAKIFEEIDRLKTRKSEVPLLYDLSDSMLDCSELRKKFNFVLIHSNSVKELEVLDSEIIQYNSNWDDINSSNNFVKSFQFNLFGLSYGIPNLDNTTQFLESKGVQLSQLPKMYFNHHVAYAYRRFIMQSNIFYGWNQVFSDSSKRVNYNLFGINLGLGATVLNNEKFSFSVMALGGGIYQQLESYPESKDILNVNNNIVKIESQMFVYGGLAQFTYKFNRFVGLGLKYQLMYSPNDIRWDYKNSGILYQNVGKSSHSVFSDLGLYFNFNYLMY